VGDVLVEELCGAAPRRARRKTLCRKLDCQSRDAAATSPSMTARTNAETASHAFLFRCRHEAGARERNAAQNRQEPAARDRSRAQSAQRLDVARGRANVGNADVRLV
jgi:hypothetical protein